MAAVTDTSLRSQLRKLERIAPALAGLARGAYTAEVAQGSGVSTVTILNWMDWSWRHRAETEQYLRDQYPDLTPEQLASLWARIERRRAKRQRRLDVTSILTRKESGG